MNLADQQLARQKRIHASLIGLANDVRFRDFMETVRECRENALDNLTDSALIQSERGSLACIGEVASYKALIRVYDEAVAQVAMQREEKA